MSEKEKCPNVAAFRRYWPGRTPDLVCVEHADDTLAVSRALGSDIHMDPVEGGECSCSTGRLQRVVTR